MVKIGLVVLLSLFAGRTLAQHYFVFIGSDNRQPFYVRLDSQFYSSSPEGHLILGRLADTSYQLTVGFPGQLQPERQYDFAIHRKDQEFQLKKQDDGSWKLYDVLAKGWVTMEEKAGPSEGARAAGIKKDDAFSRMMAALVHDTAVQYNTYAMEQALSDSPAVAKSSPTPDSPAATKPAPTPDSAAMIKGIPVSGNAGMTKTNPSPDSIKTSPTPDSTALTKPNPAPDSALSAHAGTQPPPPAGSLPSATAPPSPGARIIKLSEKRSSRSVRQVYTDQTAGARADTIVVIIPVDTARAAGANPARPHSTDTPRTHDIAKPADTTRSRTPDLSRTHPVDTSQPAKTQEPMPYVNSDCHNFATEYDVDKLRVKMLDAANDDDRIIQARKVFRTKCFYTSQVSALSEVFPTDAGKFRFFQAAWPFAADEHFHQLSVLLHDPSYIAKFNDMTGQH